MFVKVLQTRHTKIGTLRSGTILDVEQLGPKGGAVIEALLAQDNPALKELTKKQVEAEKEAVVSLQPKIDPEDKTSIDIDVLGDLQGKLKASEGLTSLMTTELKETVEAREVINDLANSLQDDLKTMTAYRDELTETVMSESKRADTAEETAKALQKDLDKVKSAQSAAEAKSDGESK
jgi:hypothetical protein